MEDLDLTEKVPDQTGPFGAATVPMPKLDIEPLVKRAAEGTRSNRALPLPRAPRGSVPPPIPARARTASLPPPIPAPRASARIAAVPPPIPRPRATTSIVAPLPPPMPSIDIDVSIEPASTTEAFFNEAPAERDQTFVPPRSRAPWKYAIGAGIVGVASCAVVAFALRGDAASVGNAASAGNPAPVTAPIAPVSAPNIGAPAPKIEAPASKQIDAPAPKQIETPAPVEVVATNAASEGNDVSIHSWPEGATVTLVDDGNARVIGKTPLVAKIDPARSYDVVIAAHDRPTAMRHLEVGDRELLVDLDPEPVTLPEEKPVAKPIAKPAAKKQVAAAPTPIAAPKQVATKPSAPKQVAPPKQVAMAKPDASTHAMPANTGTLDVSTKPPCEIFIDGQSTRLTTPQRGIALSPGAHSITFKNASERIQKSVAVRIEKGRTTKLIQSFLAK